MLKSFGFSKLRIAKIALGPPSIRIRPVRAVFEETPDIQVLDSILAIQVVQCAALTEGHGE